MTNNKNISFSPPDMTNEEINEVVDALQSGWITTGPKTKKFEKQIADYVGVKKAACLNSATAAMELSLHILGVGPGDEVITSAYTYTASASVIHHLGAKIVLVDTSPGSFEMDYSQLENLINKNTKVIIPVDIAGVICDYDKIFEIVNRKSYLFFPENERQKAVNRIVVMADAAHSFGAIKNGKNSGQFADITCFSFHAVKNLTTAEGGAVVWTNSLGMTDDELYNEYMLLSLHGQSKDALSKTQKGSWEYDIIYPAYKCNMTDILASIGIAQLNRYDTLLAKRFNLIKLYEKYLDTNKVSFLSHQGENFRSSGHLFLCTIKEFDVEKRNKLITGLSNFGISTNVHYKPLPMMTAYKKMGFNINDFPNAYNMYKSEITLPLYPQLNESDIMYICEKIKDLLYEQSV